MSALLPNPYLNAAAVEAMLYKGIVAPSGVALAERDAGVLLRSYRFYGHLPEKCMADELRLQALLHRANLHTMQQGVQRQQQLVDALEGARTLAEAGKLTPAMMQAVGETRVRQMTTGSLPAALQLSQTKRAATLRAQDLQSFIDWADREFAQQGRSDRRILLRHAVRPGDDTTTTAARVLGVTGQGMRERFKGLPQSRRGPPGRPAGEADAAAALLGLAAGSPKPKEADTPTTCPVDVDLTASLNLPA